jgi:oligoendopeptidase F
MSKVKRLPTRDKVRPQDTWDLGSLFPDDAAWEKGIKRLEGLIPRYAGFKGTLGKGARELAACLKFDYEFRRLAEKVGVYAYLKFAEDQGNGEGRVRRDRVMTVSARADEASSYVRPELMAIAPAKLKKFLADPALKPYLIPLERVVRYRPHTLTEPEERLLAMQTEMAEATNQIFSALNNVDLKFGEFDAGEGPAELSHSSYLSLMQHRDQEVRHRAFKQYYAEYKDHAQTLASTLAGSIKRDVFEARARNFPSALEAALFSDNISVKVYDGLVGAVHRHLPTLHRYYEVRRKALGLRKIRMCDVYLPLAAEVEKKHTWDQAVKAVIEACAPLGAEYVGALRKGLEGRWCDRYENKGKQSGAFSYGTFDGDPYILMNYRPDVIDHVFTLAHEAGHSMHSWYSVRHQPYEVHDYSIFVAEVASTFNEQLLNRHFLDRAKTDAERAFFLCRELDEIRTTLIRQTMFAEFERLSHGLAEKGEPLTLERMTGEYRKLLEAYFGPGFTLDDELSLECLRIPHFYRAFYVYKYATGLAAAIALSRRVLEGGKAELDAYLGMLKAGGSKWPLEILRDAGVDMETPEPVEAALTQFAKRLDELEKLI